MSGFIQPVGLVLITVVLSLGLHKEGKDITLLLGLGACCMVLAAAVAYLQPVINLIGRLQALSGLDTELLNVVIKSVGIGLIAEIASLICTDSGNGALGKTVHILASAAILWLSVPLFRSLIELIQKIVGEI